MNSFLRRTVPTAFLAGGILLGGAGAAGAQLPVDSLLPAGGQGDSSALLSRTIEMLTSGGVSDAVDLGGVGGGVVPMAGDTFEQASSLADETTAAVETVTNGDVATEAGSAAVQVQGDVEHVEAPAPHQAPEWPPACCEEETPETVPPTIPPTTVPPTVPVPETTVPATPETTPAPIAHELPRTGSTVAPWVAAGAGLLLAGGALVGLSARRNALRGA